MDTPGFFADSLPHMLTFIKAGHEPIHPFKVIPLPPKPLPPPEPKNARWVLCPSPPLDTGCSRKQVSTLVPPNSPKLHPTEHQLVRSILFLNPAHPYYKQFWNEVQMDEVMERFYTIQPSVYGFQTGAHDSTPSFFREVTRELYTADDYWRSKEYAASSTETK